MKYNDCKSELFEFSFLSGVQPSGVFLRKRNICGQNPYVFGTIWSSFTIDFFVYWESGSRRCSKMAINWVVSSIVIPNKYYGVKVPLVRSPPGGFGGAGAPPRCRPPSFLVMDEVNRRESQSCFNLAENFKASSLWVGSHRYTRIFWVSKLIWV